MKKIEINKVFLQDAQSNLFYYSKNKELHINPNYIKNCCVDAIAQKKGKNLNYKAIFFDYDGVLTTDKTGSLSTNKYISNITGIDYIKIDSVIRPYNDDLLMGRISHLDIWDDICKNLNIKLNYSILIDAFKSTPINTEMFLLAKKLNSKYNVGIITDNKKDRIDCLREHQKLDTIFSPIIVSAEIGCNKKNKAIFEKAISSLQLKPEDCIFIDNTNDNLVVPKEMGMATIFHDDKINDIIGLENILKENYKVYQVN